MNISRWMPGLAMLRDYKPAHLPHDLAAGVTLGVGRSVLGDPEG